jgi:oligoendopeptidase F
MLPLARTSIARWLLALGAVPLLVGSTIGQERERSQIQDQYKWDLTALYPTGEAWRQAKDRVSAQIPKVKQYQGKLGESSARLLEALQALTTLNKEVARLYVYAGLLADQDTRDSRPQAMRQEMARLASTYGAEAAFVEPEILKMDRAKIAAFIKERPGLGPYAHYLDDILRRQAHTGSEAEERLIAQAGLISGAASDIYGVLADADFPYPSVTLADGRTVRLNPAAFNLYRGLPNRDDRRKVMSAFFTALGSFRRTFGTTMNANVQKDIFYTKARKYPTSLDAALDESNIPVAVYRSLVDGVDANLATFQRYLKLRKRMMGLDQLHYYDLYAPLVGSVDLDYPIDQAQKLILEALAPLGADYTSVIQRAFKERWIDLYPNAGKRAGAYSNGGAYDVHPYMLINYNGKYADVSTLAHELGHTMQSYLSNKAQPYPTADYPIFVAEVASTFNEALLIDHMLRSITDDNARLSLLGNYLENIKGTLFRQTQFAEFELRTHEMAEKGETLTGDALSALYFDITKKYYGHDAGVCIVDDYVANEWAFIPHFYRSFYVYQYATSFTASAALSERVLAGDAAARLRYLQFLSAGGSDYPITLLEQAGVDMTTRGPLELTMQKMNRVMDDMEKLLAKRSQ